jgi:adenine phosphoribosyltransferase
MQATHAHPDQPTLEHHRATVRGLLREVPDFPEPGVLFRDIAPVLGSPEGLVAVADGMTQLCPSDLTLVAGIEARGFVLGTPIALALQRGFVAIRKKGKLPSPTIGVSYDLEYGSAQIEMPQTAIHSGDHVVIVDDVLATGGIADAACRLIEEAGGMVVSLVFLMELTALGGRDRLAGRQVDALLSLG